jgi:DNA gyrase inhibitor GyrI
MKLTIEQIPPLRIAYVRHVGPYGSGNVETMEKLKSWARLKDLLDDRSTILGIARDNPETTKPENCRYDTCLVISDDYRLEGEEIGEGAVDGGKYAVFLIDHTAEAVQKAWIELFAELYGQGYEFDESRPILERYKAELVARHYCEICVPVNE